MLAISLLPLVASGPKPDDTSADQARAEVKAEASARAVEAAAAKEWKALQAGVEAVVRANVDTLYSSACLDLSKESMLLSLSDTKGRYYLMPMLDVWTNVFASPGSRTTGTKAGHFAITGPG